MGKIHFTTKDGKKISFKTSTFGVKNPKIKMKTSTNKRIKKTGIKPIKGSQILLCFSHNIHPYNCDGMFGGECMHCERCYTERFPIMKFISQLLSTQKSELIKRIEGVKIRPIIGGILGPQDFQRGFSLGKEKGYDLALSDILSLLNNKN